MFYDNLEAADAIDANARGGVEMLMRQMLRAIGDKWAAHELVWKPSPDGLRVETRFVPLWFFERTVGRLRFLESDGSLYGTELEPDKWLVTVGDGIMRATSIASTLSRLTQQDWMAFAEKFGMPGVQVKTAAKRGSDEWRAAEDCVRDFGHNFGCVTSLTDAITLIERSGGGELPFPALINMFKQTIFALWRGGDLSTQSQGNQAVGANPQQEEKTALLEADAAMIEAALNQQLDNFVIRYHFGDNVKPLAYFRVCLPKREATAQDISVFQFAVSNGVPVGVSTFRERFNIPKPAEDEELLTAAQARDPMNDLTGATPPGPRPNTPDAGQGDPPSPRSLPNAQDAPDAAAAVEAYRTALAADLQPIRDRLAAILRIVDPALRAAKLSALRDELPALLADINADPATSRILEGQLWEGLKAGIDGKAPQNLGATPAA